MPIKMRFVYKGGKGSGNFGHSGRPGKIGGSGGGSGKGGGSTIRSDTVTLSDVKSVGVEYDEDEDAYEGVFDMKGDASTFFEEVYNSYEGDGQPPQFTQLDNMLRQAAGNSIPKKYSTMEYSDGAYDPDTDTSQVAVMFYQ